LINKWEKVITTKYITILGKYMWITIDIDNKEIFLNDFLAKLPSSNCMLELIEEIQKIKENWNSINIKILNKSKEYNEDNEMLKHI
jgi:hypothetical protein